MPAEDGDPVVSEAEHEAWHEWRVTYVVTLEATPFKVAAPCSCSLARSVPADGAGTTLFLPVFSPTVEVGEVTLTDLRHDAILVNRSHLRRVRNATRH